MIVESKTEQPIGSVIRPFAVTDVDGNMIHKQPLFVIREASLQEWREEVIREGGNPDQWEPYPYHYEVTTDLKHSRGSRISQPKPKTGTALKRTAIKKRRSKPRRGVVKDPAYLEWIRQKPCMVCAEWLGRTNLSINDLQKTPTEAAHVGDRGLGQKCSDREAIPLCERHHRTGPFAHHVLGKKFWAYHSLDRDAIIAQLNKEYDGF